VYVLWDSLKADNPGKYLQLAKQAIFSIFGPGYGISSDLETTTIIYDGKILFIKGHW
jgi:hypothetical protein